MKSIFLGHYWLVLAVYFSLITALLLAVAYLFRRKWVEGTKARRLAINLSVSLFTTLYLLLALEGITAYAVVQSDGFGGATLASKRWFHQYWHPHNSYGYRDHEPEWKDKVLFVVGDSFVAGHGVRNIDGRFSNRLSDKLGEDWTVTTLAKNGWSPQNYLDALTNHDKTPDVIILSYFINDIQNAASEAGLRIPKIIDSPKNKLISSLMRYSYLVDWAYWRIHESDLVSDKFWNYLQQCYSNPDVWERHLQELDALIHHADTVDAEIAFIV